MKRKGYFLLICAFITGFVVFQKKGVGGYKDAIPEDVERDSAKNRRWSAEEAAAYAANFDKIRKSMQLSATNTRGTAGLSDVSLLGRWISRGPYNMPGSFEFCEVDEGTNDVYAVSTGHYGGVQFIWKGTLAGDNWEIINPKNPSRFQDLIVIPNGTARRIIASHELGQIMYSDNGGQDWIYATGIPSGLYSTIVNRQDNNVLYATNGKIVYKSTDKGTSFTSFYTIGTSNVNNARLYTPRWNIQPNAIDVYLAVDNKFFKLNAAKTSFNLVNNTLPNATGGDAGRISLGGDSRKLWLITNNKWFYSTDAGVTFTYQSSKDNYYGSESEGMLPGGHPGVAGVNPTDPNIIIGGGTFPLSTRNGFIAQNNDAQNYWGYYQNSVGNDPKVRIHYHPDMQASQFFYDQSGKLISLRSTDGGVFISSDEWEKTSFPTLASIETIFYNISLFDHPSQETYRGAFMIGKNDINDLTVGTQDQGSQNSRLSSYNNTVLSWDQVAGGDGNCMITGDGTIGWLADYFGTNFKRLQLYNGTYYAGIQGPGSPFQSFTFTGGSYFTPLVGDWNDGNRIWVLSQTLRRIEYNTTTQAITGKEDNLANSNNFIQGIAQSHVTPSLVYALHNGIVFKSTNTGTDWTQIATQVSTGMTGDGDNRGMGWSSPVNKDIVLFASQSGTAVKSIFSKDGGTTWKNVTGTGSNLFPNAEVNGMAGTQDGRYVFASTNMGPYVFIVSEENWYPLAVQVGIPIFWGQIVYCQKYNGVEYARFSTWGQGVWDFEINANAVLSLKDNVVHTNNSREIIIDVYPNPTADKINVTIPEGLAGKAMIAIYNQAGQKVFNTTSNNTKTTIDMSRFANGTYLVKLMSGKKETVKKVIVKH